MSVVKCGLLHPQATLYQTSSVFDDFYSYTSTQAWTSVASAGGSTVATGTGGVDALLCTTAATANDYQGFASTNTNFLFTSGVGMSAECILTFANQSSNNAAVAFGFSSSTAIAPAATTSAISASYSGAVIYKRGGEAVWRVQSSNATAKTENVSQLRAVDGTFQLRIDVTNYDALNAKVTFTINGQVVVDATSGLGVSQKVPYSALAAMKILGYNQAGASSAQAIQFDYVTASKNRNFVLTF